EVLRAWPIWYHKQAKPQIRAMNHYADSKCLREKHKMRTAGEAENLARGLTGRDHRNSDECECEICMEMEAKYHCERPHSCMTRAKKLLDTLPGKWDPRLAVSNPDEGNEDEQEDERQIPQFKPNIITATQLTDVFRIFTQGRVFNSLGEIPKQRQNEAGRITIATDGSCADNGDDDARAGAGGYISVNDPRNFAIKIPDSLEQSNQTGELIAI
ncbi:hypothetical protein BXZ70DRAFT_862950, partial [Cristinia sonorae]